MPTQTISLPDITADFTVSSTPKGPKVTMEKDGVKMSFVITTHSALKLIEALEQCVRSK